MPLLLCGATLLVHRRSPRILAGSARPGLAQGGVTDVEVRLDLRAAPLVDELPAHDAPGVSQTVPGRGQLALDAVDAFTDHNLYPVGALAQDHDVQGLPGFRSYLDLLCIHRLITSASWIASARPQARHRNGR